MTNGEDHRSIGLMSESSAAQAHLVLADGTVLWAMVSAIAVP